MKRQTILILTAVFLLGALPLVLVPTPPPAADGEEVGHFEGADGQAEVAITEIAPAYEPWFSPLYEPPGGEVESLLFALQAALGTGVLGYWLGASVARSRERERQKKTAAHNSAP